MVNIDQNELQPAADEPTNLEPKEGSSEEKKQVEKSAQSGDETPPKTSPKDYSEKNFEELILEFENFLKQIKFHLLRTTPNKYELLSIKNIPLFSKKKRRNFSKRAVMKLTLNIK